MPAAPRAQPTDYFDAAQWRWLTARSSWRGLWLVAHCWGVIGLAMWAGATWPPLIPLAVLVVGTRQLGLFILMHDAAHGLLHPNRRVNDFVGHGLCSSTLGRYRPYHLQHHRFVQQSEDPDLVLSAPFPITRASLRRKAWRDLSGQTFYKQRLSGLVARIRQGRQAGKSDALAAGQELAKDGRFLLANALGFVVFAAVGGWWVWLLMWLLPMLTWLPFITRIRNIAEHAVVADNLDPLRNTRTTIANRLERLFLAPYYVNYHLEHHLFFYVPAYNLPKIHRWLMTGPHRRCLEVEQGYRRVLTKATARSLAADQLVSAVTVTGRTNAELTANKDRIRSGF